MGALASKHRGGTIHREYLINGVRVYLEPSLKDVSEQELPNLISIIEGFDALSLKQMGGPCTVLAEFGDKTYFYYRGKKRWVRLFDWDHLKGSYHADGGYYSPTQCAVIFKNDEIEGLEVITPENTIAINASEILSCRALALAFNNP